MIRLGIVGSLVAGGLAGVLAGLIVAWPGAAEYGRSFGIITGVTVTLSIALLFVGIPLVEQLLVRALIARSGILPWPGRPLLDHASGLLLLRKVGQDYIFVHRELLDFFADLSPERHPSLLSEPSDRNVRRRRANLWYHHRSERLSDRAPTPVPMSSIRSVGSP